MNFIVDNLLLVGLALVSGGLLLWPLLKRGAGAATLGPLEATQLINHHNATIVDLRDEKEFALGSLAGARNIPDAALKARASELVRFKARPLLLICGNGQQSTRAIATFNDLGFTDVHALAGGVAAWKTAALPLVLSTRGDARQGPKDSGRKGKSDHRNRPQKPRDAASDAVEPVVPLQVGTSVAAADEALTDGRIKEAS